MIFLLWDTRKPSIGDLKIAAVVRAKLRRSYKDDDHCQEQRAGCGGAHPEPSIGLSLGKLIPERCAQRPSQDVGDPERQDRVRSQPPGGIGGANHRAENQSAIGEAKSQRLGRQIAGGGAEREGAEDRGPIEQLATERDDVVN